MRNRWVILAGLALVLVAAAAWLIATQPLAASRGVDFPDIQRRFASELGAEGTVGISDAAAFRAVLASIPHGPPPGFPEPSARPDGVDAAEPSPRMHARLLTVIEEFLGHLAAKDADAYCAWVRSRGYELSEEAGVVGRYASGWEYFTGEELPPDLDHEQVF